MLSSNKSSPYQLLPFRFERIKDNKTLIVNEVGELMFLPNGDFEKLISYELDVNSDAFLNLKSKHIATDTDIAPIVDILAVKYRTKKAFLNNFTSLHMVVVTLRCNSDCQYCQVTREEKNSKQCDMTIGTAKKVVDLIFKSPAPIIKIEFQGGEPTLNFGIVRYIVKYAKKLNKKHRKQLEFVICTNLTLSNKAIFRFLKKHNVYISTSLDGPKELHDKNRILQDGKGSYDTIINRINEARSIMGKDGVDALMTTTNLSLKYSKEIVDEYMKMGFRGIFIRSLNPYGFAKKREKEVGYSTDEFIKFYKEALMYIIDLNIKGSFFMEFYTTLLLTRILTPFSTGFVDLQSPTGAGIQGVVYNYDGNVYVADEGRMLAAMGDKKFLMGNVYKNTYREIFCSEMMKDLIKNSCLECLPMCSHCAFQTYCGADPVRNYSTQGDIIGYRPTSEICEKNKAIIQFLMELIEENNDEIMDVFWSWINGFKRNKQEVCIETD